MRDRRSRAGRWRWLASAALAVVSRPRLWPVALRQVRRLAPDRWWRRWPPLPLPDASYLEFRLRTMYGDDGPGRSGADVVAYLRWCRQMDALS